MTFPEQLLDLIKGFTLRRAFSLVLFLAIILGTAWAVEAYSGYLSLDRLEKATDLIERINTLDKEGISHESTRLARDEVMHQVGRLITVSKPAVTLATEDSWFTRTAILEFVFGALPWFVISLTTLPSIWKGDKNVVAGFLALQLFTVTFGLISIAVPNFGRWWIDYFLVPWGIFVVVAIIPMSIAAASAFRKVRDSSQKRAVLNQMRMLAAAADQYRLENGTDPTSLAEIVGPDKYVKSLLSVNGESYDGLDFRVGSEWVVRMKNGEIVTYQS